MEELNRHMEELHHFTDQMTEESHRFTDQSLDDSRAAAEQATHTLNNNMFSNNDMFGGGFGDSGMGMLLNLNVFIKFCYTIYSYIKRRVFYEERF